MKAWSLKVTMDNYGNIIANTPETSLSNSFPDALHWVSVQGIWDGVTLSLQRPTNQKYLD